MRSNSCSPVNALAGIIIIKVYMQSLFRTIRHKIIIKKLQISENASILDTSCQDGGFLAVLLENNKDKNLKLFGIDIDSSEIAKVEKLFPQASFTVTDNKNIPYTDKTFDVLISSMTLHHMSDPMSSIAEMKRVVKDDGCIYLVDLIAQSKIFYSLLKHAKCPEPYHFEKFYFLPDVAEMLSENGLKVERINQAIVFPSATIFTPVLILKITKQ